MAKFDRYDVIPVIVLVVVAIVAATAIFIWLDQSGRPVYAAPAAFDHSDCQYPTRLTNPPDGCDNSDSACGVLKDGTEPCPVAKDDSQSIFESKVPPVASHAVKISSCKE